MNLTTASAPGKPEFKRNRLLLILAVLYFALWVWLAVSPYDRSDWLLENLLVFVFVGGLALSNRRFPLSDLSYLSIALFLTLHAIGAHYTYAKAPLGFWLQDAFDLDRNHFDRIVHFSFGFLLGYPIREILLRAIKASGRWVFFLSCQIVLALSAMFELLESWVAQIVSPELGAAYLGTQGDVWDAQNDTTAAFVGALLCYSLVAIARQFVRADSGAIPGLFDWMRTNEVMIERPDLSLNPSGQKYLEAPK